MYEFKPVTKEVFAKNCSGSFCKTFISKATTYDFWDKAIALWVDGVLVGGYVVTINRQKIHNLQLIIVFDEFQGNGYGKLMMNNLLENKDMYLRISSEKTAQGFYESLGFIFQCRQKSGTLLTVARVINGLVSYPKGDETIRKVLGRKGKGSCYENLMGY